jgi:integrase
MAGRTSYDRAVERGITQRHESRCAARTGKRCTCRTVAYIATAQVAGKRRYSPTLRTLDAARRWRRDALEGTLEAPPTPASQTLEATWRQFHDAAEAGIALNRNGDPYKPRAIKDYDSAMSVHVLPRIGTTPFGQVTSERVQLLIDDLAAANVSASRQHAAGTALRALSRWASRRGLGPRLSDLLLPRVATRKPTILGPVEVAELLALVRDPQPALFAALAAYSGARAYEIVALEAADIDRESRTIRLGVRDDARKSPAALRTVPILSPLVPFLDAHLVADGPLFGPREKLRARYDRMYLDTRQAWSGQEPRPTPHTLRHNWVSWLLAAGVPLPAVQRLSGHETPMVAGVTLAVYGHAMDAHVDDARITMDAWLDTQAGAGQS